MTTANARLSRIKDHLAETGAVARAPTSSSAINATPFAARTTHTMERMARERAKASFPVRDMTYFLDGGRSMTEVKEGMMADLAANPVFTDPEWNDLNRDQIRERTISRLRAAYKLLIRDGADVSRRNARLEIHALHDLGWYVRQGVHFGLFMGALAGQGSDEQRAEWLPRTMMCEDTQEFVINSPRTQALNGGSVRQGRRPHIRWSSPASSFPQGRTWVCTTSSYPSGIWKRICPSLASTLVIWGAKMGLNGIDNGWMQFDHVRVPRDNMLCRYAQVPLLALRPDAVALVDAFNYSDEVLNSHLGTANGDIYTGYLQQLAVAPYIMREVKPLMQGADLISTDEEED
ncbi:hypothetical protein NSK_007192 [Nannochloropsis salina CCMP1776]|uniref:Acyl-coenzyme A oxidase N-terminal domain-containing protein n=1 Tax=Nannochloropsis salina CCMP1776 TaxID=1027361 RepID=A0A4D9CQS5_9STRA|nr:hypothetical protein NSK_007192 [Nannochloropsis salina CCMP1776]|eukprot:TFJ81470.1 hypothetical protein NSK_007192 [Nannochloropsis salina CCMP1776]